MKSTVPLQTELGQQYESGSEVQLSGGKVVPSKDVVSDNIKAQGKALMSVGQIINKLEDGVFHSNLFFNYNDSEKIVDARTSDAVALAIRFDAPMGQSSTGNNGSIHHNVIWNASGGIMAKGDYHDISNNTVFDVSAFAL